MSFHPILGIRSSAENLILSRPYRASPGIVRVPSCSTKQMPFVDRPHSQSVRGVRAGTAPIDDSAYAWQLLRPCEYTLQGLALSDVSCTNGCYEYKKYGTPNLGTGGDDDDYMHCAPYTEGGWVSGVCPSNTLSSGSGPTCPQYQID